jgi:hypothetical protein
MRPEELAERKLKQPFQPFRLHVAGGATYEIRQSQMIWVMLDRVLVFFPDKRLPPPAFDGHESIPLEDIIRLDPLDLPVQPGST